MQDIDEWVKKNFHVLLPIIVLIFVGFIIGLYFLQNNTTIVSLSSYLSGWSSLILLLVTTIYVVFSGKQMQETKNQRLHQFNALPESNIAFGIITSPSVRLDPFDGEVVLKISIRLHCEMKNIGNSSGLFQIFSGTFHEKKNQIGNRSSTYIQSIDSGEDKKIGLSFHDEDCKISDMLIQNTHEACPMSKLMSVLLYTRSVYRNIENVYFSYSNDNVIFIDDEEQEILSKWIGFYKSFNKVYSEKIEQHKAVYKNNREKAHSLFDEIEKDFYLKCPKNVIPVYFSPIKQSYKYSEITPKEYQNIYRKNNFGMPIGFSDKHKEEYAEEIEKMRKKYIEE
jgi:hypothetical protein